MSLNNTPSGERPHIGFFGKRNAGKSSLVNAVTGQQLAIVSHVAGTTTDPVTKAMELLPLGPVVIIDTPGIDDEGELGKLRVEKSYQALAKTDIAVVVVDGSVGLTEPEKELIEKLKKRETPYIVVYTKSDISAHPTKSENEICVSAKTGEGIHQLKEMIAAAKREEKEVRIIGDKLNEGDMVVLVVPIDKAAPKGRLILPQQQTIRDILDSHAMCVVTQDDKLIQTLQMLNVKPKFVICDSQVFAKVSKDTPEDISLTSFSILFANYKGNLRQAVQGVKALDSINDNDEVLIAEGCTHHRQCGDIGTVKLPALIKRFTGKEPNFTWTSGTEFRDDLTKYKLVIHCGGCMLNETEMQSRLSTAKAQGVPMTNYGIAIAYMNGILKRSLSPFPSISDIV
ncbi:MAG: [Clostridia bacterium]|nr:[FeFe] hydrogenase H-cluster maturation GTPase HydF [Clostridia bacterium]